MAAPTKSDGQNLAPPKNRRSAGQKLRSSLKLLDERSEFLRASGDTTAAADLEIAVMTARNMIAPPAPAARDRILTTLRRRRDELQRIVDHRLADSEPAELETRELKAHERLLATLAMRWPQP